MTVKKGMAIGMIGALLTLAGDFQIGANPTADIATGQPMLDSFIDGVYNSDFRMVMGGMLGVVGIPLEGAGYFQVYKMLKNEKGIMPKFYLFSIFAYIALAGAGVHLPCALIPLLYKWIAPVSTELALEVMTRYVNYFMMPPMVAFSILLFIALLWQSIVIARGKTAYPKLAVFYNMAFGVLVSYLISMAIGNNIVGNAIATGAISFGHLWMFGMMTAKLPEAYKKL